MNCFAYRSHFMQLALFPFSQIFSLGRFLSGSCHVRKFFRGENSPFIFRQSAGISGRVRSGNWRSASRLWRLRRLQRTRRNVRSADTTGRVDAIPGSLVDQRLDHPRPQSRVHRRRGGNARQHKKRRRNRRHSSCQRRLINPLGVIISYWPWLKLIVLSLKAQATSNITYTSSNTSIQDAFLFRRGRRGTIKASLRRPENRFEDLFAGKPLLSKLGTVPSGMRQKQRPRRRGFDPSQMLPTETSVFRVQTIVVGHESPVPRQEGGVKGTWKGD